MSGTVHVGERYRRNSAPHDYVWVTGNYNRSVGFRAAGSHVSIPEAEFLRQFTHKPKRRRLRRS